MDGPPSPEEPRAELPLPRLPTTISTSPRTRPPRREASKAVAQVAGIVSGLIDPIRDGFRSLESLNAESKEPPKEARYQCRVCGQKFISAQQLGGHQNLHRSETSGARARAGGGGTEGGGGKASRKVPRSGRTSRQAQFEPLTVDITASTGQNAARPHLGTSRDPRSGTVSEVLPLEGAGTQNTLNSLEHSNFEQLKAHASLEDRINYHEMSTDECGDEGRGYGDHKLRDSVLAKRSVDKRLVGALHRTRPTNNQLL